VFIVVYSEAPFHLTRRGWGEFPVRVQLHFRDGVTKSVDVIHKLTVCCMLSFRMAAIFGLVNSVLHPSWVTKLSTGIAGIKAGMSPLLGGR